MLRLNRLSATLAVAVVLAISSGPLLAKTKKGDKLIKQGRQAEATEKWDEALDLYEKALAEDPTDSLYLVSFRRARFQAGQMHVKNGKELRQQGKLEEALREFQRGYAIDPSSTIAEQELRRTFRMIRQKEKDKESGQAEAEDEEGLTPLERAKRETEKRIERLQDVPVLKPISPRLNTLKMNNQPIEVLYETVGKLAGINVVFDPEFQSTGKNYDVDLSNASLEAALRYLSVLTKTFWKPLNENTIFITNDNVTKRRDYEEVVVKVFYLKNITKVQELQEIITAVRSVTDIRRMFAYNSQNAILVRGTGDQVALAEKLIYDLDKPLAEVVVDVVVMEANRVRTRDLASSIMSGAQAGLSFPFTFTGGTPSSGGGGNGDGGDGGTTTTAGGVPLGQLRNLSSSDWSVALPNALLQALMTDNSTRIIQRPQLRAADGQKASLRLGDRIPFATGSFQPGVGAVGVSPLVSTQFQFAEVGVNVDLTPKIHGEDEISLHIELDISTERGRIDIGGLSQPIIGQRKITEDIRVKDGQVTLLGGLSQDQTSRTKSGVPGLSNIPIIKWLGFGNEGKERNQGELLIALVPHIVRRPEIDEINLRGVAAGSDQLVRLTYATNGLDRDQEEPEQPPAAEPEPPVPGPSPIPGEPQPAESPEPQPPTTMAVQFNPPAVSTKRGATFSVSLTIQNATDVFNAPLKIRFDPKLLRLNEIRRGPFLAGDGQQVIFTRNILNDSGDASVVLNRLPGSRGVSGTGTLITLTFQATGQGVSTQVTMPEMTIRDSEMGQIPATAPVLNVAIE